MVAEESIEDILEVATKIIEHFMEKNSEMEAVDLLMEIDQLDKLIGLIQKDKYKKVYDYIIASSHFAADTDEYLKSLGIAYAIAMKFEDNSNALRVAIKMDDEEKITEAFNSCKDLAVKRQ